MIEERYLLAKERIYEIDLETRENRRQKEEKAELPKEYKRYFHQVADFLKLMIETNESIAAGRLTDYSLEELKKLNHDLYADILPEHYEESYANPVFSVSRLSKEYGRLLGFLYTELRSMIPAVFEQDKEALVIHMELFLEIYSSFTCAWQEEGSLPASEEIREILYYFLSDYAREATEKKLSFLFCPEEDFAWKLLKSCDLSDPRYLYYFGEYITENELRTFQHLKQLSKEKLSKMADTYTEGYRIGFEVGNKDLSKKKIVNIRYCLGFERMIVKAISNFEKMGLKPVIYRAPASFLYGKSFNRNGYYGAIPNKQYDFDHKDDMGLFLDKRLVQVRLEALKEGFEHFKEQAALFGGPAVIEVFGEAPANLVSKAEAVSLSKEQQKLSVEYASNASKIQNQYIKGDERSFTIIAFPTPEIGKKYEEIFDEVIRINTLDYSLYQTMQQKIIDVLDQGSYVLVKGMNGNHTNMKIMLHTLEQPKKQTNFENCVADVNIPVGEVFTSPVLTGTEGVLHVKKVFLEGLEYRDLELKFTDGKITAYSCKNYPTEEENRRYIQDNILFHHETLPIGEFAIGTNTTAYVAGRKYKMEDKLPILIAEKTGPHFAVGDTCYSYAEDVAVFNPDGKEIIARDNECSIFRKTDPEKAYFNCHTDITIPYDELSEISVVGDGVVSIIEEGKFVLPGLEELNKPLEELWQE